MQYHEIVETVSGCESFSFLRKMGKPHTHLGIGAIVSARADFLEPKELLRAKYGPTYQTAVLDNLHVEGYEEGVDEKGKKVVFLHLTHVDYPTERFKAKSGSVHLVKQGAEDQFLSRLRASSAAAAGKNFYFHLFLWGEEPYISCALSIRYFSIAGLS